MSTGKHILLISYVFPPYPGVGGRRWAKFAKYLAQRGYTVHVLTAESPLPEMSLFMQDVAHPNIKVIRLPALYPAVQVKEVKTFFDKVMYRITLSNLKKKTKGNYYDRGISWKKQLLYYGSKCIKAHGIKNVIITGAPFSLLHHAIDLKQMFPEINLLGDLRDPWTWGSGYGMQGLTADRKDEEKRMEKEVMEKFDAIFIPSVEMKAHLDKTYSALASKFNVLPHGFDEAEVQPIPKTTSAKKRFLFYGTIYKEIEPSFVKLADFISKHSSEMVLDIFTFTKRYSSYFEEKGILGNAVNYYPPLPPEELFASFENYDYIFVIQPDFATDHITTKMYEIIYANRPVVLIADEGKLAKFVKENKIGYHMVPSKIEEGMQEILAKRTDELSSQSFSVKEYSFAALTDKLVAYFQ